MAYTSDHGFYMGEHGWFDKQFMYEESLRTPFAMRYPGKIKSGSVVSEMIVNIDFAPTLIQLAGVEVPKDMHSESFAGLLSGGKKNEWRKSMYYHYHNTKIQRR